MPQQQQQGPPGPQEMQLLAGAYQARGLLAGLQRCVNMYPEAEKSFSWEPSAGSQAPIPVTHFLTPGLLKAGVSPNQQPFRKLGLYRATNDELYAVCGGAVYLIDANYVFTAVGNIAASVTPVVMQDNGLCLVITDGTAIGYTLDLTTHAFGTFGAAQGYSASSFVVFIDTYLVFIIDGTNQFYLSYSNVTAAMLIAGTAFDPLDVAAKTGQPDPIQALMVINGELWLIGLLTTEVWADTGGAEFAFQRVQGAVIPHGTIAKYSIAQTDTAGYFLMQDRQGFGMIVQTAGYALKQISTYAVTEDIQKYGQVTSAFGYTRQSEGHAFYVLTFPDADRTWEIELATFQAHEWSSGDGNGVQHRHRANCYVAAFGTNFVGDYLSDNLYVLDDGTYNDDGTGILRLRTFPHILNIGNYMEHVYLRLNIECGMIVDPAADPMVSLRWSDDRGYSYGNALEQSIGKTGQVNTWPRFNKLGRARDRVYEVSWTVDAKVALGGAYIFTSPFKS